MDRTSFQSASISRDDYGTAGMACIAAGREMHTARCSLPRTDNRYAVQQCSSSMSLGDVSRNKGAPEQPDTTAFLGRKRVVRAESAFGCPKWWWNAEVMQVMSRVEHERMGKSASSRPSLLFVALPSRPSGVKSSDRPAAVEALESQSDHIRQQEHHHYHPPTSQHFSYTPQINTYLFSKCLRNSASAMCPSTPPR